MILETLSYCFNSISCPKYIKELGLLQDLVGIESRYARHNSAWQEHLEKTKSIILTEALKLKKRDQILILGAGSLHDVPLKELSENFGEVHLVDIFFLQNTINKIRYYPNVDFHEVDISGVLRRFYEDPKNLLAISDLIPKHFLQDENIDLVVSLNLLSQLPLPVQNYYEKRKFNLANFDKFLQALILNHLLYLKTFALNGKKVLLITDTEKQVYDVDDKLQLAESSLQGLDTNIFNGFEAIDQWTWELAPLGELAKDFAMKLKVQGLKI